jgi:SAM-dependent methyltransferase
MRMRSAVCRYEHFESDWYARWAETLRFPVKVSPDSPRGYRKVWEWAAMLETMLQRGLLTPGKKALGFAVGREPLAAILASHGVEVLATDLAAEQADQGWKDTAQHAESLHSIFHEHLVDRRTFERLVTFRPADMNDLSTLEGEYDFLWSSCAFEHLGSLEHGLAFVVNAMRLLKPGGFAIHTTEFNVASNDDTIREGVACIYRRRDFEELDHRLRRIGCGLEATDYNSGAHPYDLLFDRQPYYSAGRVHIKLELDGHICTSALLVARKG